MAGLEEALAALAAGPSPFHRRLLLLTGFTQLADAMALMVVAFLETQIPCVLPGVTPAGLNGMTTAGVCLFILHMRNRLCIGVWLRAEAGAPVGGGGGYSL